MITELLGRCFQARDIAHKAHWETKSYAEHKALGAFYSDVIGAADTLAETYIGEFGRFGKVLTPIALEVDDIATYLQEESDWISMSRSEIANGSPCIENLIDSLTAVYNQTIYMLSLK